MERYTMSLEEQLAVEFDEFIAQKGYSNRSEAMRDLIRDRIESERLKTWAEGHCVGTLSYVYNHHESELAGRVTSAQHDHHDITMSSMHVHLDHDNCLEVVILRGTIAVVRSFAESVIAERGVRHGKLHLVPVEMQESAHAPDGSRHIHSSPKT